MFEYSSGVSPVSLQFSPQVVSHGRSRSTALPALASSALFGAAVLVALALYSGGELLLADSLLVETTPSTFAASLRASVLVSTLCLFGFLGTLTTLRHVWAQVHASARVAASLCAAIAVLFVLGLNTRGPIAYAVDIGATNFWPLGLVLLALGMSMALSAIQLGQIFSDALSPLEEWSRAEEQAQRARRLRFAASLGRAAKRPSSNARARIMKRQSTSRATRTTRFETAGLIRPLRSPYRSCSRETPPSPRARGLFSRLTPRTAATAPLGLKRPFVTVRRRGSGAIPLSLEVRDLLSRLQPYWVIRRTVDVITSGLRRLNLFRAVSSGRKAAQANLPIDLTGCGQETTHDRSRNSVAHDRDGLGRQAAKTQRSSGCADHVQGKSLQGTLFRVR